MKRLLTVFFCFENVDAAIITIRFPIRVMIAIKDRTAVFTINCQEQMLTALSASEQKDFEVVVFMLLNFLTSHVLSSHLSGACYSIESRAEFLAFPSTYKYFQCFINTFFKADTLHDYTRDTSSIIIHSESVNSPRESDFTFKIHIQKYMRSHGRPNIVGNVALIMADLFIC